MMLKRSAIYFIFLIPLFLSACANAVTVNEHVVRFDGDIFVKESARQGQMQTKVIGTDFDADTSALFQAVTEAMPGSYFGPEIEFVSEPDRNRLDIRTIFVINPPHGLNMHTVCTAPDDIDLAPVSDEFRIAGVFCKNRQTIRYAVAHGPKPSSIQDPMFREYVASITSYLLSPRNTDRNGCDDSNC